MFDFLNGWINEAENLIQNGISAAALAFVGIVFWRTKAMAPTLGALLLAGAVIWGVNNMDWFEGKIGEEASMSARPAVVVGR